MYEMPTVAVILAGATVGLLIVIGLTCKALGGWYFLAAQICGFTAMLQLVHGVGVAYAGFCEHRPSPLATSLVCGRVLVACRRKRSGADG